MAVKYIIGIDEVGRGALAGPVTVAAVAVPISFRGKNDLGLPLRDSKKLLPTYRERWFSFVKEKGILFAVAHVQPSIIDRVNISKAANLAASRALNKLALAKPKLVSGSRVMLDGGLYLRESSLVALPRSSLTIIKGDEKVPAIALASIIAKVRRDRLMVRMHKKFPGYGFAAHKGYGTVRHIKMCRKMGLSAFHRRSFSRGMLLSKASFDILGAR
jgi:ribonuclease HII